ncbi:MAG TPA: hypothetical protein ACFYED_04895 [Candidatus Tripitaka californicus]|uniref:hypothetical protein n=1 Tax=Candidatus Tripitaka californicus TaxID=3367616 RepID=UPI0040265ABE|nr:hypothetical protein [Planctomycetota bacterium]
MGRNKVKIKLGNEVFEGTSIERTSSSENWSEYLLEDGSVVKMKLVVTEIVRVDGRYDSDDNPMYIVKSSNVIAVSSPDNLKRKV